MARIKNSYLVGLSVIGVAIFGGAVGLVSATSVSVLGVLMIALTILSAWVRIELDQRPSYIDLTPFTVFVTLLVVGPSIALLAAVCSAFVSARFLARNPWHVVAAGMAEEGMAVLAAVFLVVRTRLAVGDLSSGEGLLAFFMTVAAYVAVKLVLAAVRSKVAEGIDALSFVGNAGKLMIVHLIVLPVVALGVTLLYAKVGWLTLPLATIALIELYVPGKLIGDQRDSLSANLSVIAQAIDLKDAYTAGHVLRVEMLAVRTARAMRLSEAEVRKVRYGAWMHDVGKVGVSIKIILKPAALDPAEWAIIKQHPVIGAEILQPVELLSEAAEIVRHHHENYDGSGYPDGLKGDDIPIGSRIIMVTDAFDAMTTDRAYRRRRPKDEALRELRQHAGSQFDPKVVKAFESIINLVEPPADQSASRAA